MAKNTTAHKYGTNSDGEDILSVAGSEKEMDPKMRIWGVAVKGAEGTGMVGIRFGVSYSRMASCLAIYLIFH